MLYLDTAILLTLFLPEPSSREVEAWLERQEGGFACSDWGLTEAASALGIRVRRGDYAPAQAMRTWQAMAGFAQRHCRLFPANASHQGVAQSWLTRCNLNLRAGDALHLAIAQSHGLPLATYDQLLLDSAAVLGIATRNPLCQ